MARKPSTQVLKFGSEAELCAEFLKTVGPEWIVYNETGGFDILLVNRENGAQVGIEAKLAMNAKLLAQALKYRSPFAKSGPDFTAILVPKVNPDFVKICDEIGITVLTMKRVRRRASPKFYGNYVEGQPYYSAPRLPRFWDDLKYHYDHGDWFDLAPPRRLALPDYVPDVAAGKTAPLQLSLWKIKAIKLCVLMARNGFVTRKDFRALRLSPTLWFTSKWISLSEERGILRATEWFPAEKWRSLHPSSFEEIEADYPSWSRKMKEEAK